MKASIFGNTSRLTWVTSLLAKLLVGAASAQTWLEPPTELGPNNLVDGTPAGIVTIGLAGTYPEFTAELEALDVLGVISGEQPDSYPADRPKDLNIGIFDTWEQAVTTYRFLGLEPFAQIIEQNAPAPDDLFTGRQLVQDGQVIWLITFRRQTDAVLRDDR